MKIKKLYDNAKLPTKGSQKAAGWDLYAYYPDEKHTFLVRPGEVVKVQTGISVALDTGTAALILPRSGLATRQGLRPANTPGLIDADYRGEVIVALKNDTDETQFFYLGDRIAQMMVVPYITSEFEVVDELDETTRGDGGFGSSGK